MESNHFLKKVQSHFGQAFEIYTPPTKNNLDNTLFLVNNIPFLLNRFMDGVCLGFSYEKTLFDGGQSFSFFRAYNNISVEKINKFILNNLHLIHVTNIPNTYPKDHFNVGQIFISKLNFLELKF